MKTLGLLLMVMVALWPAPVSVSFALGQAWASLSGVMKHQNPIDASLDDFRMYNVALTDNQVAVLYADSMTP